MCGGPIRDQKALDAEDLKSINDLCANTTVDLIVHNSRTRENAEFNQPCVIPEVIPELECRWNAGWKIGDVIPIWSTLFSILCLVPSSKRDAHISFILSSVLPQVLCFASLVNPDNYGVNVKLTSMTGPFKQVFCIRKNWSNQLLTNIAAPLFNKGLPRMSKKALYVKLWTMRLQLQGNYMRLGILLLALIVGRAEALGDPSPRSDWHWFEFFLSVVQFFYCSMIIALWIVCQKIAPGWIFADMCIFILSWCFYTIDSVWLYIPIMWLPASALFRFVHKIVKDMSLPKTSVLDEYKMVLHAMVPPVALGKESIEKILNVLYSHERKIDTLSSTVLSVETKTDSVLVNMKSESKSIKKKIKKHVNFLLDAVKEPHSSRIMGFNGVYRGSHLVFNVPFCGELMLPFTEFDRVLNILGYKARANWWEVESPVIPPILIEDYPLPVKEGCPMVPLEDVDFPLFQTSGFNPDGSFCSFGMKVMQFGNVSWILGPLHTNVPSHVEFRDAKGNILRTKVFDYGRLAFTALDVVFYPVEGASQFPSAKFSPVTEYESVYLTHNFNDEKVWKTYSGRIPENAFYGPANEYVRHNVGTRKGCCGLPLFSGKKVFGMHSRFTTDVDFWGDIQETNAGVSSTALRFALLHLEKQLSFSKEGIVNQWGYQAAMVNFIDIMAETYLGNNAVLLDLYAPRLVTNSSSVRFRAPNDAERLATLKKLGFDVVTDDTLKDVTDLQLMINKDNPNAGDYVAWDRDTLSHRLASIYYAQDFWDMAKRRGKSHDEMIKEFLTNPPVDLIPGAVPVPVDFKSQHRFNEEKKQELGVPLVSKHPADLFLPPTEVASRLIPAKGIKGKGRDDHQSARDRKFQHIEDMVQDFERKQGYTFDDQFLEKNDYDDTSWSNYLIDQEQTFGNDYHTFEGLPLNPIVETPVAPPVVPLPQSSFVNLLSPPLPEEISPLFALRPPRKARPQKKASPIQVTDGYGMPDLSNKATRTSFVNHMKLYASRSKTRTKPRVSHSVVSELGSLYKGIISASHSRWQAPPIDLESKTLMKDVESHLRTYVLSSSFAPVAKGTCGYLSQFASKGEYVGRVVNKGKTSESVSLNPTRWDSFMRDVEAIIDSLRLNTSWDFDISVQPKDEPTKIKKIESGMNRIVFNPNPAVTILGCCFGRDVQNVIIPEHFSLGLDLDHFSSAERFYENTKNSVGSDGKANDVGFTRESVEDIGAVYDVIYGVKSLQSELWYASMGLRSWTPTYVLPDGGVYAKLFVGYLPSGFWNTTIVTSWDTWLICRENGIKVHVCGDDNRALTTEETMKSLFSEYGKELEFGVKDFCSRVLVEIDLRTVPLPDHPRRNPKNGKMGMFSWKNVSPIEAKTKFLSNVNYVKSAMNFVNMKKDDRPEALRSAARNFALNPMPFVNKVADLGVKIDQKDFLLQCSHQLFSRRFQRPQKIYSVEVTD